MDHCHRVEGVERQSGFLTLAGDNIPARAGRIEEDVLEVLLHDVGDMAAIHAAGLLDISRAQQLLVA